MLRGIREIIRSPSGAIRWCTTAVLAMLLLTGCGNRRGSSVASSGIVTLAAVGDILLDRGVNQQIQQRGIAYPFAEVAPILGRADLRYGNLECPLSAHGIKVVKRFCFKAPPANVRSLGLGHISVASLANNHTMDCGRPGLVETMQTLRGAGIRWCGAGANASEAEAPTIFRVHGLRVAFVGFCEFVPEGSAVRTDRPTIAFSSDATIRRSVARARRQADVVVACFHWGVEYQSRPTPGQIEMAHSSVDAGADLVLGDHPHVLQGIERISRGGRRALIIYSLGNFVFDQGLSVERGEGPVTDTAILEFSLNRSGVAGARVIPVMIENYRPCPATGADAHRILSRMAGLSRELGTRMHGGIVL